MTRIALSLGLVVALGSLGCGSDNNGLLFDTDSGVGADGGDNSDTSIQFGGDSSVETGPNCVNLQCRQDPCGTTNLTGTVVTGTPTNLYGGPDPIYNAIVYVPNAPVAAFTPGVTCDKCGTPVSGNPVVITLTDEKGNFTLKNVPSGSSIPLVVQVGRWRRQIVIPNVNKCVDNALTKDQTRMPRNQKEGDIPHIAIASSTYDAEECILRKMGVDDAEFTDPMKNGRIHIYHGNGVTTPNSPSDTALWSSLKTMQQYDMMLFPCSSAPTIGSDPGQPGKDLETYMNSGGRVFATDLSYSWFKDNSGVSGGLPKTAGWTTWGGINPYTNPLPAFVDQTFPKGKALAAWLKNIGATPTLGQIGLQETYHVVDTVNAPTSRWLYSQAPSPPTIQTISFNTPIGKPADQQCGRGVYSNFHVANGQSGGGQTFPNECNASPLSAQEKVMEFMFFDLGSCVQDDTVPPQPPPN